MPENKFDLTGATFKSLVVLGRHPEKGHNSKWYCRCSLCGNIKALARPYLVSGKAEDCGCRRSEKIRRVTRKHGDCKAFGTRGYEIYKKWMQMRNRCNDPKKPYLRKGITVCQEWQSYETFKMWADTPNFDPKLELDRIDNSKGYSPDNCRWVTHAENCKNKSNPLAKAVINEQGRVFPSAQAASKVLGMERNAVGKSIAMGYRCAGQYWKFCTL
jgi:hypothetical protein